jgi:hypothetical protein
MAAVVRHLGKPVVTDRMGRWEHEIDRASDREAFGAEHNPTGNPIGGGEGYGEILQDGDFVVRSYEEMRRALSEAKDGQVVFVPADATVDFSGQEALQIPEGVTVASDRGLDASPGGLLCSTPLITPGMLRTAGDCVRVTGLRIRGPYQDRERIAQGSSGFSAHHFAAEVDNCEISGFANSATAFPAGAARGYVHHNHIHHNQKAGLGYGVSVGGGEVLVEANLFDYCRHHIASSGAPGAAYEARYNVCGQHANGHLFDMHGGRDRGDATDIAGDWMHIHHNTFQCTVARSVGIRGVPSQGARIHHNWFFSPDRENIVRTGGETRVYQNVLGPERALSAETEVATWG